MRAPSSDIVHRVRQCLVQLCALTGPVLQDPVALSAYTRRLVVAVVQMASKYVHGRRERKRRKGRGGRPPHAKKHPLTNTQTRVPALFDVLTNTNTHTRVLALQIHAVARGRPGAAVPGTDVPTHRPLCWHGGALRDGGLVDGRSSQAGYRASGRASEVREGKGA